MSAAPEAPTASGCGSGAWQGVRAGAPLAPPVDGEEADLAWARSGAMALAGRAEESPRLAPGPLALAAEAAVARLGRLTGSRAVAELDGAALLGERAALFGLQRRGAVSPGGSCRLLPAADGWLAVNLPRPDDRRALGAWLEADPTGADPWAFVARQLAAGPVDVLVERARLLGLAVAPVRPPPTAVRPWCTTTSPGARRERAPGERPRVVDLSSLWAGPLCTHLLERGGAEVVKVESPARPDGARRGPPAFYDLLHAGKRSVALDLGSARGRSALRALLRRADVVVEASRPRALEQLGICAEDFVAEAEGLVWVSLTGYGRTGPDGQAVAFGDDATAAAGLCAAAGDPGAPLFCGDAIADPLAGLHAAVAAWSAFSAGGGVLVDVSLVGVVAHLLALPGAGSARVERRGGATEVCAGGRREPVRSPRARRPRRRARPLGADTEAVLGELGIPC